MPAIGIANMIPTKPKTDPLQIIENSIHTGCNSILFPMILGTNMYASKTWPTL